MAPDECCICHLPKTDPSGSGYEKIVTCITETAAKKLKRSSDYKQDNVLLSADMAGKDWKAIVAYEIGYHRSCYRSYTRDDRSFEAHDEAVKQVIEIVKAKVVQHNETITPKELQIAYNQNSWMENLQ